MIASIHQPSTSTFELFDQLLLLSQGKTCYSGPVELVKQYFDTKGFPMPVQTNPAEFLLELTNIDFARGDNNVQRLETIQTAWAESQEAASITSELERDSQAENRQPLVLDAPSKRSAFAIPLTLLHRSFIKSYRDVVVYGIRILMYTGMLSFFQRVSTPALT